jgi:hypothetical protein
MGSVLLKTHGLPGFVVGQVAASVFVLGAVLLLFSRRGLPRPPVSFFLARVLLSALVWGGAAALGRWLPLWPWWRHALLGAGLLLLANVVLVRGGFFSREEENRAVEHLAGKGAAGRVVRFLLAWPRGGFLASRRAAS